MSKTSGIIHKQGQSDRWNFGYWPPRYFTLENNIFAYYLDETKPELKGLYRLGKDDTIETKDGVLSLTSTFYKEMKALGGGTVQTLNMKFGDKKDHDHWFKTLRTVIKYAQTAPAYSGRCFCGKMEWGLRGKCLAETTCHCSDCSYFQATSTNLMFLPGSLTVTKGNEFLQTSASTKSNSSTLRHFCRDCHTFCFAEFPAYNAIGVPHAHLCHVSTPTLSRNLPKFHIHYASRSKVIKDGQLKYADLPSMFGGTGKLLDDDGRAMADSPLPGSTRRLAVAEMQNGSKQVALVTYGSSGLGYEVCKLLGESGYLVVLAGLASKEVDQAARQLREAGAQVEELCMDPTSSESVTSAVEIFSERHECLDVLVNNGVLSDVEWTSIVSDVDVEEARSSVDMVLFGAWRVTKSFAPFLKAAATGARVVMVSRGASACGISQLAVNGLAVKFAHEFSSECIMVNSVCVGLMSGEESDGAKGRGKVNRGSVFGGIGGGKVSAGVDSSLAEGASGVVWAATLAPGGPTGGFFRDGKPLSF